MTKSGPVTKICLPYRILLVKIHISPSIQSQTCGGGSLTKPVNWEWVCCKVFWHMIPSNASRPNKLWRAPTLKSFRFPSIHQCFLHGLRKVSWAHARHSLPRRNHRRAGRSSNNWAVTIFQPFKQLLVVRLVLFLMQIWTNDNWQWRQGLVLSSRIFVRWIVEWFKNWRIFFLYERRL